MSAPFTRSSSVEFSSLLTSGSSSSSPLSSNRSGCSQTIAGMPAAMLPETERGKPGAREESEADTDLDGRGELSDNDDGSDFEDSLKKPRKTRKTSLKVTQAAKKVRRDEIAAMDLFEAIRQGRSAMQILVDDWLDGYKRSHEPALLELVNFVMQACGCKGVVTQEMMANMQNADIIKKMTEDFDEDSADYPLSLHTMPWKKFRSNFGEFLGTLVNCCQYNIIYDEVLMDTLISLLAGLSDSQVRAFRHTSTFAAMKLMTGLVKVARNLSLHLDTSQRQLNVERAKSPKKRAPERLETLQEKMREIHSNLEDIGNMMNGLFKGVFVHRYRDTHTDVRALCIEELGVWIKTYPCSFLNDSCLKYLGWTLHDKQGHVRLQCIRSLQELYVVPEWAGKLELFTSRFKDRMVSMVLDKEPLASAEVIKLIGLVYKNMENILTKEDCERVDPLVYTSNRTVAVAAGAFLYQRLLGVKVAEQSLSHRNGRGSRAAFFRLLVSFFISSELHEHASYLVDSLWDSAGSQLRDWECQTDLLLMTDAGLDDEEESALIEILVSTIRQAAEGTSPVGRVPPKKVQSVKDRKAHSEDKSRLSRYMIIALPHLLAKFSADADKMAALLKVVGYLELEIYCTERLEKHLDLLLAQICDVLEKHTDAAVLGGCSRALYLLSDRGHALHKRTDITLSNLVDRLTDQFLNHIPDILQESDLDEDDVYNTAATMKRLSTLYSAHNLTRWNLYEPCKHILRRALHTSEVPEQIVLPALVCCHFSLLWELFHFSSSQPPEEELVALRKRLRLFCSMCQNFLSDLHSSVREQAFKLLSDLLVIFNGRVSRGDRSSLQLLVYMPGLPLQAELAGFLVDHVFNNSEDSDSVDEEHRTDQLHDRRILLAGYCKLILYNTLDLRFASEVFKYYVKFYTYYGDIIKETLHRSRTVDKEESTKTILLSLTQAYTGLSLDDNSPGRRFTHPFLEIRDLARRLSLLFGPDQLRNRQDFVLLHKEGIKFSLRASPGAEWSPQNLLFLDVLSEFSPKLLKQDKAVLLHYLAEICRQCIPAQVYHEADDIWLPLHAYKKSLGTDGEPGTTTPSHAGNRRVKDRRPAQAPEASPHNKRRKTSKGTEGIEDASRAMGNGERAPLMSSTLLQGRPTDSSPARGTANDKDSSDSDFDNSESFKIRRPTRTPSFLLSSHTETLSTLQGSLHRESFKIRRPTRTPRCFLGTRTETPSTLQGSLHRLSLMEEEDDDDDEMMIIDTESSVSSTGVEDLPDLLDSAILDSEE